MWEGWRLQMHIGCGISLGEIDVFGKLLELVVAHH